MGVRGRGSDHSDGNRIRKFNGWREMGKGGDWHGVPICPSPILPRAYRGSLPSIALSQHHITALPHQNNGKFAAPPTLTATVANADARTRGNASAAVPMRTRVLPWQGKGLAGSEGAVLSGLVFGGAPARDHMVPSAAGLTPAPVTGAQGRSRRHFRRTFLQRSLPRCQPGARVCHVSHACVTSVTRESRGIGRFEPLCHPLPLCLAVFTMDKCPQVPTSDNIVRCGTRTEKMWHGGRTSKLGDTAAMAWPRNVHEQTKRKKGRKCSRASRASPKLDRGHTITTKRMLFRITNGSSA